MHLLIYSFQSDLRTAIQDVQDYAAALSPGLLTLKNKFHVLSHLPDHILRFGPALLFSTERYESFNHIFRLCSIHSNRQAPSRDIATTFANQDRCRHIMTGGSWFDSRRCQWVTASPLVLNHIRDSQHDARLLGVMPEKPSRPGAMELITTKAVNARTPHLLSWTDTCIPHLNPLITPRTGVWHLAKSIVTASGDVAKDGSQVLIKCGREASKPNSISFNY